MNTTNFDIKTIIELIRTNFRFIGTVVLIFTVLSTLYSFLAQQYYESYISVYKTDDSPQINQLQGFNNIAQTLGFDLGNSSSFDYYFPDLVNSRTLYEAVIFNKWKTESFDTSVNLIEFWEVDAKGNFISTIFKIR